MKINDEALESEIERIVDERVEKRLTELLRADDSSADPPGENGRISTARRRSILKALGVGAVGFGAGVVPCVSGGEFQAAPSEQARTNDGAAQGTNNDVAGNETERNDGASAEDGIVAQSQDGVVQNQRGDIGLIARPGEIQSRIDEAAAGPGNGRVVLQPGVEYDPGSEIHVKEGVTIDFNGGRIVQTSDHNTVFVDHSARIHNGLIDRSALGTSAASTAVLLNAGRAGDDYRNAADDYTGVSVECNVLGAGSDSEGIGLQLVGRGDLGIDLGNEFDMQIRNCGKGLDVYTERYLNGPVFRLGLTGNRIDIDHRGTAIFDSTVYGWIQPEPGSQVGIRNRTSNRSVMFAGEFWDPTRYEQYSLQGPNITVLSSAANAQSFVETTTGGDNTAVQSWDGERRDVYNAGSDSTFESRFDGEIMQYRVSGERIVDIGEDFVRIRGQLRNDSSGVDGSPSSGRNSSQ